MGAFRSRFLQILGTLERVAERSCQLSVVMMAGLVLLQVVLRYVFRAPLMWVEEASIFLMIWMTFLGAGVALRRGAHVALTLLLQRLPAKISRTLFVASCIIVLGFLFIVAWQGWLLAMSVDERSPALSVPMFWPYLIIPLGSGFMISQVVAMLLELGPVRRGGAGDADDWTLRSAG